MIHLFSNDHPSGDSPPFRKWTWARTGSDAAHRCREYSRRHRVGRL